MTAVPSSVRAGAVPALPARGADPPGGGPPRRLRHRPHGPGRPGLHPAPDAGRQADPDAVRGAPAADRVAPAPRTRAPRRLARRNPSMRSTLSALTLLAAAPALAATEAEVLET